MITIEPYLPDSPSDYLAQWIQLRKRLWPSMSEEKLHDECEAQLYDVHRQVLFAIDKPVESQHDHPIETNSQKSRVIGFIETSIHRYQTPDQHTHQAKASYYGHIEGWYVAPAFQAQGIGRDLLNAAKDALLHQHIRHLYSDTTDDYPLSAHAHERAGFTALPAIQLYIKNTQ